MVEYKFISENEMDRIAETILEEAGILNIDYNEQEKIDIDNLIEFKYGLEMEWKNIDNFSTKGIVLAAIYPKHKTIFMNETKLDIFEKKIGTMNFSKAHELGHWVLHVNHTSKYKQLELLDTDVYFCRSYSKKNTEEIQADMFAASILMPKSYIFSCINEIKSVRQVTFKDLYELADNLEVSISSMVNRVNSLNLLYVDESGIIHESKSVLKGQLKLF